MARAVLAMLGPTAVTGSNAAQDESFAFPPLAFQLTCGGMVGFGLDPAKP